ncbi:cardiolipin synthase [Lactococcus lactis]|uniref:cardiolipin synthase n=1 Tax=Lactococcus lactis TaxID=1358 RepID=UPI0005147B7B|nr:cardiolipin synthase [Lactococcus lactis]KGF75943.1 Cardiolipin synthetase [Lactococcus lactis]
MNYVLLIIKIIILINSIIALWTVFKKQRTISTTWAWLLTLIIFPICGFLLYSFLGRGIDNKSKKIIKQATIPDNQKNYINSSIKAYEKRLESRDGVFSQYLMTTENVIFTQNNKISFYYNGKDKFDRLFKDLYNAKETIHVEYYSFFNDNIGRKFVSILEMKAKEGVKIRLIYDPWGSGGNHKEFFKKLISNGGIVIPFITSKNFITKRRLNYHLHRKIVVIDGMISWTGGFNVGDQYMGHSKKFGFWRDTHGRIFGYGTHIIQETFIKDWNASISNKEYFIKYSKLLFPEISSAYFDNKIKIYTLSSGPDSNRYTIRNAFLQVFMSAKKLIWIQTPYLVPDDAIYTAISVALQKGVSVKIMIPNMPDHPFIFRATQYYANLLHKEGAEIYLYDKGFIHAKTIVIDDRISIFGSTNQDVRSYELNFEISSFIDDENINQEFKNQYKLDIDNSKLLTDAMINEQNIWLKFKQHFSRLISPIL